MRKAYFALHQMMSAAVADRRLAYDPTQDAPLPAEQHGEQRFLSAEEVGTLTESTAPHLRALVLVAAYGACGSGS